MKVQPNNNYNYDKCIVRAHPYMTKQKKLTFIGALHYRAVLT